MTRPNRTRQALLGFLTWGPMSGYDMRRLIDESTANFWAESYGRIYPTLAELHREGLVSKSEAPSEGGRPRHVYAITAAGRRAFEAWLVEPAQQQPPRNELLLKLFFAARLDPAAATELILRFQEEQREAAARYASIRERLDAAKQPPDDLRFWRLTLDYGEREVEAHLAWCEAALAEVRRPKRGKTRPAKARRGAPERKR